MKLHIHDYEQIGKPKHSHYTVDGIEVLNVQCECQICGKKKEKKFIGHIIGHLGGW